MNRFVVDVSRPRDRASATSEGRARQPPPPAVRSVARREGAASAHAGLRGSQLWFARAVMSPDPGAEDEALDLLTPGPRQGALDRLAVYQRGYVARLVECLVDDYPVLQHALGESDFDELCRAYVAKHPSTGPSLNFFGRHMAGFCRDDAHPSLPHRTFAADLATLEWAIVEVIHLPGSAPLTVEGLREVPMAAWADARLVANTASRLLRFDHPVNAYFQAFREDRGPAIPGPAPSATVVYRGEANVWRMDLTVPMFDVLSSLMAGESLGVALGRGQASLGDVDDERAAQLVLAWFREWVASGLFARVEFE